MKYLLEIGLFIIVLFLYLHIYYHLKVSNDLEVYSIQQPSKDKLEEVCNLRQPLYFDMTNDDILQTCNLSYRNTMVASDYTLLPAYPWKAVV